MSEHTPLPWTTKRAAPGFDRDVGIVAPGCSGVIAECFEEFRAKGDRRPDEAEANAEFIVRACNSHEELMEALREIAKGEGAFSRDPLEHAGNTIENMKALALAAIAKAEVR